MALNVLGGELQSCSTNPMTGFYRTGCCDTGSADVGVHTVCVVVTEAFLDYSLSQGNDLLTAVPQYGFPDSSPASLVLCQPVATGPRGWGPLMWCSRPPSACT
jgi:hypothetical protein